MTSRAATVFFSALRLSRPTRLRVNGCARPASSSAASTSSYGQSSGILASESVVDLRSDTVCHPTPEMREAMFAAAVGDDVFGEDPTVLELEEYAAGLFGKESALFVPTGTMGNLLAILSHTRGAFGSEYIVGDQQHTYIYEQGNTASIGGVHSCVLPNEPDGTLPLDLVEASIRAPRWLLSQAHPDNTRAA